MKKVTRKLVNQESVKLLTGYLIEHFETKCFPVRVTLERFVKPRSMNQNATMHMWFGEIAEQTGSDPKSVKSDLKAMFLEEVEGMKGVIRTKDTHELTTPEMMDFMENIQAFASEWDFILTQPVMNH